MKNEEFFGRAASPRPVGACLRRAIRSITFAAVGGFGGSATIPLANEK